MPEREWKLGKDLITSDNMLDGFTFADVILAVHCNCREITPGQVRKQVHETLAGRLEDLDYLLEKNIEEIMKEARKGREA